MKIYLCTTVTSNNYKSWSNIPYLLHRNLQKKGCKVENVVLKEFLLFKILFNFPIRVLIKFFGLKTTYFYFRTPMHFFFTYIYSQYIRFISKREDVMLVQGFSCPPHNKKNRMILLGDWPYSYVFEKFLKRTPNHFELESIGREDQVIEAADTVVTLFPDVYQYMLEKYKNKEIYYFGNVVNVDEEVNVSIDIMRKKANSRRLLFIGKPFYLDGANELISSVEILRSRGYDLDVDIVGIEPNLINKKFDWLSIHGYLDKGNPSDKSKYYDLLENAKLFVNTTPNWNAFQATLEAMYFYNPIVVRPNESLIQMFPMLHEFSYLVDNREESLTEEIIKSIEQSELYLEKCMKARTSVGSYTWNNFTDKLVGLIK